MEDLRIKRINVAVDPVSLAAIDLLIEREGVTLTEAVRRLIGYGDFVYRAIREQREVVLTRDSHGKTKEVVLLK
jgi:hypothetical protein